MLRCATKSFSASLVSTSCKLQRQTLDVFIPEQLPIIPPQRFGAPKPPGVLESTCTAHDMAPFARHMGHVDAPFIWDADRRLALRARLDALYRSRDLCLCLAWINARTAGTPDANIRGWGQLPGWAGTSSGPPCGNAMASAQVDSWQ